MARNILIPLVVGAATFLLCSASSADVPQMINYQGKLTTASGGCLNDTVQMTFTIYSDSLGTVDEWSETQLEVTVKDGIFNVLLGSVDTIPSALFDGNVKYLGVQVESDPEMMPLKPMVSVGYAFHSAESDTAGFALSAAPDADWDIDTAGLNIYRLTGDIGIGTPSPQYKLDIRGTTGIDVGTNFNDVPLTINVPSDQSALISRIAKGGSIINVVDADGNVGLGTFSPQEKLDVDGTAQVTGFKMPTGASNGYVLTSDVSGVGSWQPGGAGASSGWVDDGNVVRLETNTDSVGIGTSNPGAPLQVGSGTHAPVLVNTTVQIDHDDATEHNMEIRNNNGATGWRINAAGSTTFGPLSAGQDLYLLGGNSTRMTLDGTSGDVGIGTTNPNARLHIVPSGVNGLIVQRDNEVHLAIKAYGSNAYPILQSIRGRGTGASPDVVQSGDELLRLNANGHLGPTSVRTGGFMFFAANQDWTGSASGTRIVLGGAKNDSPTSSEWMRLVNGNVGIGTTSPQGALDVNSTTGAFIVPRMTTEQRDALTAVNGMIMYNTTTNQFNFYENGAWVTK